MSEFSKYETIVEIGSMYCYPGTNVLRNKLKIKDAGILKEAVLKIVATRQFELYQMPVPGRFTKNHLLNIHKALFGDVFYFAGKIRQEQISKGNTMFYPPQVIENELDKLFAQIKTFVDSHTKKKDVIFKNLALFMAELNAIHPFREGNGRAIREFIRLLGLNYDFVLNWGNTDEDIILEASIRSVDDDTALIDVLEQRSE
ncbi:MAG: cell filamentation protein Fic [Clostridiales bacterium]|nr:cell filamentation protein Fic [Clostridiales bacterium]